MEKQAVIQDAKIYDVWDLWKKKPRHLAFNDTDVILVNVKAGERMVQETFITCIKPDGTFSLETPNRRSHARRAKLAKFLKYYFNVKNPEEYNLREGIKKWVGKKVELEGRFIFIP